MNHPYRYLFHKLVGWFRQSFRYLWLVAFAGYLVVLTTHAVYRNYGAQQETKALKQQLADSKLEKQRLEALVIYYKTDSFKEKELRRALLYKGKDEQMFALPESSTARNLEDDAPTKINQTQPVTLGPVWRQWMNYLWTGEK